MADKPASGWKVDPDAPPAEWLRGFIILIVVVVAFVIAILQIHGPGSY